MLRHMIVGIILLSTAPAAWAGEERPIWDGDAMPYFKASTLREVTNPDCWGGVPCVTDITVPTLTMYPAKDGGAGKAVIVLPGGGYEAEAMQHEGHDVAQALASRGITAGVLKYRLPNPVSSTAPHLTPLADVRRAVELMRAGQAFAGFESAQVGVAGFSAGAHLATVASLWPSDKADQNPDFSVLIYGVTRLTRDNQEWLEKTLYFRPLTAAEVEQNTLLDRVTDTTPPAFLVHAMDDDVCHYTESTFYADALTKKGVAMEMHLFPTGGHGFGLGKAEDGTDQWIDLAASWIKRLK